MTEIAVEAVGERLAGEHVSRGRALVAAVTAGFGAAVLVYKLLRSGGADSAD